MKPWKRILLVVLVTLTILSLLLSACGPLDNVNSGKDKDNDNDKNKDKNHENEDDVDQGAGANKVLLCHKTGSAENPYVLINISENGVNHGHSKHAGDIIPAPADGCPGTSISNGDGEEDEDTNGNKISICHKTGSAENPYVLITLSENGVIHGHSKHAGDIIPAPVDGCPETPIATDVPVK